MSEAEENLARAVDKYTDGTATALDVVEAAEAWRHSDPSIRNAEHAQLVAVHRAWHVAGPAPEVHRRAQDNLRKQWPTLARAIESIRP